MPILCTIGFSSALRKSPLTSIKMKFLLSIEIS